ncbi:MAG: MCP four helix bundle domain-containing protein, partial [Rhodoferax sp.]|nr:MCP four helix bundle domain-containing protein [Rhodoferax sp.]
MFANMKIGVRLAIGFALTLILLIVVAVIGVTRLSALNGEIENIVNDKYPKTIDAIDIIRAMNMVAQINRNLLLVTDPVETQKQLARQADQRKIISDNLDKLDKAITSDEGKRLLGNMKDTRAKFVAELDKYVGMVQRGEREAAIKLLYGEMRPVTDAYTDAIRKLVDFQDALMIKAGKEADAMAGAAENMLIVLSVVAALLSVLAGWIITRSITGPTQKLMDGADKMAQGNFEFKLDIDTKDEIGALAKSVQAMQSAVQAMIVDTNVLIKAAVDGQLETRADATKHQGDFRKIVEGVNTTLDAVIGPLNVTAKYVDDISKGVIPPVITTDYKGQYNVIKGNLNNMVKMMSDLLAQTDIIIQGAANGELEKRANADMFVGGWNKLVVGVNETVTNIVNPLNVTADYVDKIAQGNIPPAITTNYKGQYNVIKNNLNGLIDATAQQANAAMAISKGDLTAVVKVRSEGDVLAKALVEVIKAVNALVADGNLLSKATVDGDLT